MTTINYVHINFLRLIIINFLSSEKSAADLCTEEIPAVERKPQTCICFDLETTGLSKFNLYRISHDLHKIWFLSNEGIESTKKKLAKNPERFFLSHVLTSLLLNLNLFCTTCNCEPPNLVTTSLHQLYALNASYLTI